MLAFNRFLSTILGRLTVLISVFRVEKFFLIFQKFGEVLEFFYKLFSFVFDYFYEICQKICLKFLK